MAELFNTAVKYSGSPPPAKKANKMVIFGFLLVLLILPVTVYYLQLQQQYQQSAHIPAPTVNAVCQNNEVILTSRYTASNIPSGVSCTVTAKDSENYLNDAFSYKQGDPAHVKTVNTHKSIIAPGNVSFHTVCKDGFTHFDTATYSLPHACAAPTPSITPTPSGKPTPTTSPVPSSSPTPTPTPTICVTPAQVTNVKVTCSNCSH